MGITFPYSLLTTSRQLDSGLRGRSGFMLFGVLASFWPGIWFKVKGFRA